MAFQASEAEAAALQGLNLSRSRAVASSRGIFQAIFGGRVGRSFGAIGSI